MEDPVIAGFDELAEEGLQDVATALGVDADRLRAPWDSPFDEQHTVFDVLFCSQRELAEIRANLERNRPQAAPHRP